MSVAPPPPPGVSLSLGSNPESPPPLNPPLPLYSGEHFSGSWPFSPMKRNSFWFWKKWTFPDTNAPLPP
ncbi:hypothetical protein TVAG_258300 [Trichomonas vaginalis G3]|uniref:Uncharacterized protein n=1 Tax=Trichomonas vaginalis (strain ATCC PRA-98 / G3) TaxID=412133 RepID=A2E934_TRIV3|nr:hypothetical protein TVAGG3_0542220 [Trichomonas vaginalis G3]EAY10828.1 hypothetical protein TVAG_258300 [Trichomonas vaginalis G3]KAI5519916.1 hypothetical protein TVAGG3_0542220 [Trichomonas vaginalis G3]|eukprot:XP_001323051.1 hypothetical protein [Trichomonas vaginalis G3]